MRTVRWIVLGLVVGATLALPLEASADGGAFIEFGETFYLPAGQGGGPASGRAFVSVPERQQDIFDRGPFFALLLPEGEGLQEGHPLPAGTIRLGTFSIEDLGREVFVLRVRFSVPDVKSGMYSVHVCNDPCTISGFREPLIGLITIADTPAEAKLVREVEGLRGWVSGLKYRLHKVRDKNAELEARLADLAGSSDSVAPPTNRVEPAPTVVASAVTSDRPLVEAWALVALVIALLVALMSVALGMIFSRRHAATLVVPDTIAELDEETPELVRR
jgi:hypothetical protein